MQVCGTSRVRSSAPPQCALALAGIVGQTARAYRQDPSSDRYRASAVLFFVGTLDRTLSSLPIESWLCAKHDRSHPRWTAAGCRSRPAARAPVKTLPTRSDLVKTAWTDTSPGYLLRESLVGLPHLIAVPSPRAYIPLG